MFADTVLINILLRSSMIYNMIRSAGMRSDIELGLELLLVACACHHRER